MVRIFRKNTALPHSTPWRPAEKDLDQKRETSNGRCASRGMIHSLVRSYPKPRDDFLSIDNLGFLNPLKVIY